MKRLPPDDTPATLVIEGLPRMFDARPQGAGVADDLALRAGDLRFVRVPDPAWEAWLLETLSGVRREGCVRVRFLGYRWPALPPLYADALRGRIGHVIGANEWDPRRPVADTLVLAERFHTRRPAAEIRREAVVLARALGLPGLPLSHPAELDTNDLEGAAIISAFVGSPALVVLRAVPDALRAPVLNLAWRARQRGAAVLWILRDQAASQPALTPAVMHLQGGDA